MSYFLLKWAHVLGAAVLFGTGMGIAFFMFMAVRLAREDAAPSSVAGVALVSRIVVLADYVFTTTAAVVQPVTGLLLVWHVGYSLFDFWVWGSLALYVFIGICWVPVISMQVEMKRLAEAAAASGSGLPARFHELYRRWFLHGWPAFGAMLLIFWLMISKPDALF